MDFLQLVLAGALVGFAMGVTGVGGGALMTPFLLIIGYPAPVAVGTDLLYAAITKTGGAWTHHRSNHVVWPIVLYLAAGSIPAAIAMHWFVLDEQFQNSDLFEEILTRSLGVMLIATCLILILRNRLPRVSREYIRQSFFLTWVTGVFLGVCVTLTSVGAGAFGAAVLLMLHSRISTVRIVGTDIAHAVPLTLIAGLGYMAQGFVDFVLLLSLLVGSMPGIHLGSLVSPLLPEKLLRLVLVTILGLLGTYYSIFI
ncbi:MAG: sulfite exporter TauE/SafE family protein [Gammaproteobacteria bacterium]|nr:sulfite exporter TauE/SafE family protein [Gammaproteobacteria bacterium]